MINSCGAPFTPRHPFQKKFLEIYYVLMHTTSIPAVHTWRPRHGKAGDRVKIHGLVGWYRYMYMLPYCTESKSSWLGSLDQSFLYLACPIIFDSRTVRLELTRAEPNAFRVHPLNRSGTSAAHSLDDQQMVFEIHHVPPFEIHF